VKIKVSITREYDTQGEHEDLFEDVGDEVRFALSMFADDVDNLVKYNEVREQASVEVIK
jgi:hypothetical protein